MSLLKKVKLEYLTMGLFILMPFVEMYRCLFQDTISIASIALEEFVVIFYIGVLAIYTIYTIVQKKNWKFFFLSILYFGCACTYVLLHYWNLTQFNTAIYPEVSYSFITESYYIVRAYLIPIVMGIVVYQLKPDNDTFSKTIMLVSLIISSFIVVTNILGISFVSYSLENKTIAGNIFTWTSLTPTSDFDMYTSKAFFYSANQISALMFSISPIIVKNAIKKPSFINYFTLGLQVLAMIMIGTKTAAIGVLLVIVAMFVTAFALHLFKLEQLQLKKIGLIFVIFVICGYGLYSISPVQQKYDAEETAINTEEREEAEVKVDESEATLADYIKEFAYCYYINPSFLEVYPVENDEFFWKNIIERDRTLNINNRTFKIEIINRIIERNENPADRFLGIGYTSNVPYTERDYVYQYFVFGIIGVLVLIAPYFISLLYAGIKILLKYKEKLNLENCATGMALCCYLIIAYLAGHVFGMMINMLFLNLFIAKLLINVNRKEE